MPINSKRSIMSGTKKLSGNEGTCQGVKREAESSQEESSKRQRCALGDVTNAFKSSVVLNLKKGASIEGKNKVFINKRTKRLPTTMGLVLKSNTGDSLRSSQESFVSCKSNVSQKQIEQSSGVENCQDEKNRVESPAPELPPGVVDFDKETINEQNSEPNYVVDIFRYYKKREAIFKLDDYLMRQKEVSKGMRAILVDWMVEVQESFELNHETLYMAVKLVDHYLAKHVVPKSTLQLLGATATFVACKFDERSPPLIDDFLYICDDAYSRKQLITMEISILKTLDFDLGIPLSYRFLRRFARCSKVSMEILTLARFVLEMSLMEYEFIQVSDSKMAAASLLLALKMKNAGEWTPTLEYYTEYDVPSLLELMHKLNDLISVPSQKNLITVRTKYSHKVFFEVAKIPPLNLATT